MNNFYMDASAVLNFYNITGKKHLFITGCKGSGKSTLLNNLCVLLNENFDFLRSYQPRYAGNKRLEKILQTY